MKKFWRLTTPNPALVKRGMIIVMNRQAFSLWERHPCLENREKDLPPTVLVGWVERIIPKAVLRKNPFRFPYNVARNKHGA
ncbi:MAG: hypothetical protein OXP71_00830 [Candidatus Poribacteria bacterium]|nr:hypothetical protein [Candidatus Poribacteria bacterium]